jgi:shikimate kinase
MENKNIVLIGMMGSGKTTCGQLLAETLGREFCDTDAVIEARQGRTIAKIFAAEGEPYFRDLELETARELGAGGGRIIACGGGLPLRPDCMEALRPNGTVVFLNRDPGVIYDGLDTEGRPLAQQGREAFLERFAQREPIYRACADVEIKDPQTPEEAIAAILQALDL